MDEPNQHKHLDGNIQGCIALHTHTAHHQAPTIASSVPEDTVHLRTTRASSLFLEAGDIIHIPIFKFVMHTCLRIRRLESN